jgi:hypothetical protein
LAINVTLIYYEDSPAGGVVIVDAGGIDAGARKEVALY